MADKPKPHEAPQGGDRQPTHSSDGNPSQGGPPAPRHTPHQEPVKGQSQKAQIAQYFKSQGRQPDDVVWSVNGLNLRLSDLD